MELVLNVVWALVVMGGCCALIRGRSASPRALVLVAALCAAALLFPAISISDDLHQELMVFEDSSKRLQKSLTFDCALSTHVIPALAVLLTVATPTRFAQRERVRGTPTGVLRLGHRRLLEGRGPPTLA